MLAFFNAPAFGIHAEDIQNDRINYNLSTLPCLEYQQKLLKSEEEFLIKEDVKKINDGCVEGNSTYPKISDVEKHRNDGAKIYTNETEPSAEILRKLCIEPGDYTVQAMERLDKQRLLRVKYSCLQKTKEVRKDERLKGMRKDYELQKNADNLEYGAGMF
ncbi:uncharacterized protein TNCV_3652731 [Trichonephila clavipes]|nr:uncharacterized protein TNCV_3652731 [Trichonephila clavipes]